MKRYPKDLIGSAYHEAGHTVAHIVFKLKPTGATIIPDGDTFGRAFKRALVGEFDPWPPPWDPDQVEKVKKWKKECVISRYDHPEKVRNIVRKDIIACYAGYEAEKKINPKASYSRWGDDQLLLELAFSFGFMVHCGRDENDKDHWKPIPKLLKDTTKFVEEYWPEIQRVAELLLEKRVLDEDDIKELTKEILPSKRRPSSKKV